MQVALTDIGQLTDIESPQVRVCSRESQGLLAAQFVLAATMKTAGPHGSSTTRSVPLY
jgi:hypothetical protein